MSFDEKTGRMNWKDESVWVLISVVSGVLLSSVYLYFQTFPDTDHLVIVLICPVGFYLLSILLRVQNHRGEVATGKTAIDEKMLKYIFPLLGFVVGIAFLWFQS